MTYFIIVSPNSKPSFGFQTAYTTREHAEAKAALDNIEMPSIGPWSVVELAPVVTSADVDAMIAPGGEA